MHQKNKPQTPTLFDSPGTTTVTRLLLPFDHSAKVTRIFDSDYYEIRLTEPDTKKLTRLPHSQWIDRTKTDKKTGRKHVSLRPPKISEFLERQYGAWKWRTSTEDTGTWFINIAYLKKKHANTFRTNSAT